MTGTKRSLRTTDTLLLHERRRFLVALAKWVPNCLDECMPPLSGERRGPSLVTKRAVSAWHRGGDAAVDTHIREWQAHWHLTEDWLYDVGRDTLAYWAEHEDSTGPDDPLWFEMWGQPNAYEGRPTRNGLNGRVSKLNSSGDSFYILFADLAERTIYGDFEEVLGTFDPRTETKAEVRNRILASLKSRLNTILDECIEDDKQYGARSKEPKRAEHHFEWLVRVQVLGHSYYRIAGGGDDSKVTEGINSTAASIGISIPPK